MLRNLSILVVGLVLAGGAVFLGPAAGEAGSGDVTCTGTQSSDVLHNLTVPAGMSCTITAGTMIGNDVIVGAGASLFSNGAFIGHDIKATGAACIQISGKGQDSVDSPEGDPRPILTVGHDVILTGTGDSCNPNFVLNTLIGHDLVVQNSSADADWAVGTVGGNMVGNDLIVRGNSAYLAVMYNSVGHNLLVTNNTGWITYVDVNNAGNDAKCSGNNNLNGFANSAGHFNTCPN